MVQVVLYGSNTGKTKGVHLLLYFDPNPSATAVQYGVDAKIAGMAFL